MGKMRSRGEAVIDPADKSEPQAPPESAVSAEEIPLPISPPRENRRPNPQDIKLSARQYIRARQYRWERCAGFLHDMNTKHPGDKTRPEWDQLWDAFWARPIK